MIWRAPRFSHPATGWLALLMILAGVVLRIQDVGYPFYFGFDEEQMVTAARQFLIGVPDTGECCHPPLSKVMMSASILVFGDNPVAWRFPSLLLGIQSIVLVFLIARALFNDPRAGWLAAAFLAADGFAIAFSRDAFPEGMMTCFVLWSMLAAVTARGWAGVLTCAVLVGLSGSIKWSGFQVGLPACFAILILRRVPWYSIAAFAVVPLVHLGVWMIGLQLIGHPSDPMSVWEEIRARQSRHLGFVRFSNPLESSWYTWLYLYHPIVLKTAYLGERIRVASSVSNPLLFAASDLCLLGLPIVGTAAAISARVRLRCREWFDVDDRKAFAILGVSWMSMMLLWFSGRISSYWYHYLTPYGFAVILTAGVVARLDRRHGKSVMLFIALALVVLAYFAPVWAELPISVSEAHRRLIFKLWR
ncbi:MAG: glycosyltransferase family 39 protein [Deltaproteobacteria bacterium]|nr:glycosyltransferase family 39 protein [Deltaproteobacteria bacterium]